CDDPTLLNQVRIVRGRADALIGCDLVVSSSPRASVSYSKLHTRAVLNTAEMATANFVLDRDAALKADERVAAVAAAVKELDTVPANRLAGKLLGDTIYANVLTMGMAWQKGLIPLSLESITRAIELNGVKVENNLRAFGWGRLVADDAEFVSSQVTPARSFANETLDEIVQRRSEFLTEYQDESLSEKYESLIETVRRAEADLPGSSAELATAVARSYFKLLAYKDEYEVGRLHTQTGFHERIAAEFEGSYKLNYHMAPPVFNAGLDARGRPRKRAFGPWMSSALALLARFKRLRGTAFDPFGYSAERKMERALIGEFEGLVERLLGKLNKDNLATAVAIAKMPMEIRGYGPVKIGAAEQVRQDLDTMMALYDQPRPGQPAGKIAETTVA
ncbi:MAG: pyruvate ferredoxin oxidoreductase, partial [Gammaproteobacteria bacterium]|nr:pyruvate ferredoxin oxidoreductase [Gammaproteobacteria bacterium]